MMKKTDQKNRLDLGWARAPSESRDALLNAECEKGKQIMHALKTTSYSSHLLRLSASHPPGSSKLLYVVSGAHCR